GQGRAARPPHPFLDRQVRLPRRQHGEAGRSESALGAGSAALHARAEFPLDGALPFAFPRRAGRGPADLRPASRGRAPHGLHRSRRRARRRALHEALFPHRQGCRRSDADFLRLSRIGAPPPRPLLAEALGLGQALDRGLHRRCRPAGRRERASVPRRPGLAHPALPCRAKGRARHPSTCAAACDTIAAARRQRAAQQSRSQPALRRYPDLGQESRDRAAMDERGRGIRPLRSGFRPRRRADAVRHVSCLHGRRAFAVRDRHAASNRERRPQGRAAARNQHLSDIESRRVLYLAVLLHDIAKGRGGDHSILGAQVAEKLGPRFGFTAAETETVAWLVRWHLLMSNTAFKFDIDDPQTIHDFVERIQSPERLKLLFILTIADIRAVGPNVWNGWKAALLRELYHRATEVMSGGIDPAAQGQRVKAAQEAVRKRLPDFTPAEADAFIAKGYPLYWLSFDTETQERHARLVREADRGGAPLTVDTRVDAVRAVTEVTVYTADHPGLFSRIAGALALAGANIVDAKIHTLSTGMALDTFWVQDRSGGAFDQSQKLAKLSVLFENVLMGKVRPRVEFAAPEKVPSRTRVFTVPPRVLIDNSASGTYTVIEVNGRDRPGLLYEVTRALTDLNLQISSAKISTYGEKVVDVFYVKDLFGHKVEHEKKLGDIRERLILVLTDPAERAAAAQEGVAAK